MRVDETKTFPHPYLLNHFIQIGISTWTQNEPVNNQEESIRRAVYNADGIFSPHGSSEVPIEDMPLLISTCIRYDKISKKELLKIIFNAIKSLFRQLI